MSWLRNPFFIITSCRCMVWFFSCQSHLLSSLSYVLCFLCCGFFSLVFIICSMFHTSFFSFIFCASLLICKFQWTILSIYLIYLMFQLSWRHRLYIFVLFLTINSSFDIDFSSGASVQLSLCSFHTFMHNFSRWVFKLVFINQYIEIAPHFFFILVIWSFFLKITFVSLLICNLRIACHNILI